IQADAAAPNNAFAQLHQQLRPGTYYLAVAAAEPAGPAARPTYLLDATLMPALPPFQPLPVGNGPKSVAVAQFIPNGSVDIVTANSVDNTVCILLGNGDGAFQPAVSYPVGRDPVAVTVADFNGKPGIVTANYADG